MSTRAMNVWRQALRGGLHEPTVKRVRIEHGGPTVVETDRALLVWEPRRVVPTYAVPVEDLRVDLAPATEPADAPDPGRLPVLHPGIPFAKQPLHDALPVRYLLAFYNERVDIIVDGVREERPVTVFAQPG